jgi:hypothetical protein
LASHHRHDSAAELKHRGDVSGDHRIPFGIGAVHDVAARQDARVVDQNVDAPFLRQHIIHQSLGKARRRHVALDETCRSSPHPDPAFQRSAGLVIAAGQHDPPAKFRASFGNRRADAARSPRYDDDLVRKMNHMPPPRTTC